MAAASEQAETRQSDPIHNRRHGPRTDPVIHPRVRDPKLPVAGMGAFATRPIRKGTRLIEYVGERIRQSEADARYDDDAMEHHHTFLFSVDKGR